MTLPKETRSHRIPNTFPEAVRDKVWRDEIVREYTALHKRRTWYYVKHRRDMNAIPIAGVFRLKPLEQFGHSSIHKARCCASGDYQIGDVDYNPLGTYGTVASHEAMCVLFAYEASKDLVFEGEDVANAYVYCRATNVYFIQFLEPN